MNDNLQPFFQISSDMATTIILGGGLSGLSAGYILTKTGQKVIIFEADPHVGGLSKTITKGEFRFDLGGHRFITKKEKINNFVRDLMNGELISVCRKSKIYMHNKYFYYPLRPLNAIFGLGIPTTLKIISDYGIEILKKLIKKPPNISLEDWVVSNFGRKMFNIYFKEYSEKVVGIECSKISSEWVSQRVKGLSLFKAIKNAFFRFSGKDIPTLADKFLYPHLGIGRLSEKLKEEIIRHNHVFTDIRVRRIIHSNFRVKEIEVENKEHKGLISGGEFIATLPITNLINLLHPSPPENILSSAQRLRFRALVIVALMIKRRRVTDETWIYIPEKKIPFGRIHEPTNWSEKMAPDGKTLLVVEFFSFKGDSIWNEIDERLIALTTQNLEELGFIRRDEVIDSSVVRVPNAYPLFEIGYKKYLNEIYDYLIRFENLHIAGRGGMFRYYNMDHAIESGMSIAEKLIKHTL